MSHNAQGRVVVHGNSDDLLSVGAYGVDLSYTVQFSTQLHPRLLKMKETIDS
jgi:hypothetical protein